MTKPRSCLVEGCEGKHHSLNLCAKHYQSWRYNSDPKVKKKITAYQREYYHAVTKKKRLPKKIAHLEEKLK